MHRDKHPEADRSNPLPASMLSGRAEVRAQLPPRPIERRAEGGKRGRPGQPIGRGRGAALPGGRMFHGIPANAAMG
ncbi:hypothetical protein E2320_022984, partial [Naja naja]